MTKVYSKWKTVLKKSYLRRKRVFFFKLSCQYGVPSSMTIRKYEFTERTSSKKVLRWSKFNNTRQLSRKGWRFMNFIKGVTSWQTKWHVEDLQVSLFDFYSLKHWQLSRKIRDLHGLPVKNSFQGDMKVFQGEIHTVRYQITQNVYHEYKCLHR